MATYRQIQNWVKQEHGFQPKTCWIAHCKELKGLPLRTAWNRDGNRHERCSERRRPMVFAAFQHFPALRDDGIEGDLTVPGSDTVAKYRRSIATRIEWRLRTNQPAQHLQEATETIGGRTLLCNVATAKRSSPLSKPRVLREVASELAKLEKAVGATYPEILAPDSDWGVRGG